MSASLDRGGEHVPVVGVEQVDRLDERLVPGDQAVADGLVHQRAGTGQPLRVEVGPVRGQVAEDFVEDPVGPLGLHEPGLGDADQQVPERARVEHVGVVQDDEGHLRAGPSLG